MTTAQDLITHLDLAPHPEGGHYRQTWIAASQGGARPAGTCIYFLLKGGERSHWHKVDADEIWHYYAGAPLTLSIAETVNGPARDHTLGPDLLGGQAPQILVPKNQWQAASCDSADPEAFTLVGCTVSPAFHFDGFELAPPDLDIPRSF